MVGWNELCSPSSLQHLRPYLNHLAFASHILSPSGVPASTSEVFVASGPLHLIFSWQHLQVMIVMLMMTKAYDSDVFCLWRCMMEYLFAPCLRLPRWLPLAPKWYADILINLKVMALVGTFQASPTSTWPPRTAAPSPPWTNSSSVSPLIFQRCVSLFSWSMRKSFFFR